MKSIFATLLVVIISAGPVLAADYRGESAPLSSSASSERQDQEVETMKKAIRDMFGELAKNRSLLQQMTREMLSETSRNKELLKEVVRGIAKNREAIKATIKDLLKDKEFREALRADREMIRELLEDITRTDLPGKTDSP